MASDIMQEILQIEDEARNIIIEAGNRTKLMEADTEKEIERITSELEKEFKDRIHKLKSKIQKAQEEEAARLKGEFEKTRNKLEQIDPGTMEEIIHLVHRRICKT